MKQFKEFPKLQKGDKVAILSPSFAAPAVWPAVYELGLKRLRDMFGLEPIEFPATKKLNASKEERSQDLIDAFENSDIKAVIATLGGNDQVTYIKNLPSEPFINNPKPFFGYSDNTHFINHLWLNGIPSYYGGLLFTEFAMQGHLDDFTVKYLKYALFEKGSFKLEPCDSFNDIDLNWDDASLINNRRIYEENEGWYWDSEISAKGVLWGGCVESVDELLRHNIQIPSIEEFSDIVLVMETSEEIPSAEYVFRVFRALGERGILERVKAILVGRPKAWNFEEMRSGEEKIAYKKRQRETILKVVRNYNTNVPVIQNVDFGHTSPKISLPIGRLITIDSKDKTMYCEF